MPDLCQNQRPQAAAAAGARPAAPECKLRSHEDLRLVRPHPNFSDRQPFAFYESAALPLS